MGVTYLKLNGNLKTHNQRVGGSSPSGPTNKPLRYFALRVLYFKCTNNLNGFRSTQLCK